MRAPERIERLADLCDSALLAHTVEIPVLGIPTCFRTSSAAVLEVIEEAFGAWHALTPADIDRSAAAAVSIAVHDDADDQPAGAVVHEPADGGRLFIHAHGCSGISDPGRGEAAACVSRALLADRDAFRYGVLEALTWALLTRFDRQPFHAGALAADGGLLLLAGGSGTGKSTLAYAASRAGMHVLTDDIVFIQSRPHIRVWAMPAPVRLLPDAAARFPGLADPAPVRLHNGKRKVVAPLPFSMTPGAYDLCVLCILGERRAEAQAHRASEPELVAALDLHEGGFSLFADSIEPVIRVLARRGGWILHPAAAPEASLPLLREMLAGCARTTVTA